MSQRVSFYRHLFKGSADPLTSPIYLGLMPGFYVTLFKT
jgi:hypothetical protein